MQYFVSKTSPRAILVLFDRGDTLLEGLQDVVKKEKIDTAAITGGIGSFQRVHLHTITTTGFRRRTSTGISPDRSSSPASRALSSAVTSTPTSPSSTGTASRRTSATWNPAASWRIGQRSA